ncbi:MAG: Phosphatidylglycerol/phosphatidylinositol transfer protein [Chrysothrix sp. TS-e1954]|nr:MAG: Phosphatidylglycerol/phosphatidylinositol transfer protein [Chrysothrix sp. TS-e1954]
MQLPHLLPALLLTTLTSASWFDTKQSALAEEPLPVPGDNPLTYCHKPDDYILDIEKVDLAPNPPLAGKNLTITASGTLSERVDSGAKVHLEVKYGLIRILSTVVDLCDYAKEVGEECPLEKGELEFRKDVELPREIPHGKYTVLADVITKEEKKVTCLTATVIFKGEKKD